MLYALTFTENPPGARELIVSLPNGGERRMSFYQKDENAVDFPYAEIAFEDKGAAQEYADHVAGYGMKLEPIKASKFKPSAIDTPHPPSDEQPETSGKAKKK